MPHSKLAGGHPQDEPKKIEHGQERREKLNKRVEKTKKKLRKGGVLGELPSDDSSSSDDALYVTCDEDEKEMKLEAEDEESKYSLETRSIEVQTDDVSHINVIDHLEVGHDVIAESPGPSPPPVTPNIFRRAWNFLFHKK